MSSPLRPRPQSRKRTISQFLTVFLLAVSSQATLLPRLDAVAPLLQPLQQGTGSAGQGLIGSNVFPQAADAVQSIVLPTGEILAAGDATTKAKADVSKLDLQTFTGALGGVRALPITASNIAPRPFRVGEEIFDDFSDASTRTCDTQRTRCIIAAASPQRDRDGDGRPDTDRNGDGRPDGNRDRDNGPQRGGSSPRGAFTVNDCEQQKSLCEAAQRTATIKSFNLENLGPDPTEPEFDLICMP